jgi:hypothetical protein
MITRRLFLITSATGMCQFPEDSVQLSELCQKCGHPLKHHWVYRPEEKRCLHAIYKGNPSLLYPPEVVGEFVCVRRRDPDILCSCSGIERPSHIAFEFP